MPIDPSPIDPWLPMGFELAQGLSCGRALFDGPGWQIVELTGRARALLAHEALAQRWTSSGLVEEAALRGLAFGSARYRSLISEAGFALCPVAEAKLPNSRAEALAFSAALRATRNIEPAAALQDALYAAKIGRLLPTYSVIVRSDDDLVLGSWLTGGAPVSVRSFRRLRQMSSLPEPWLREVVEAAGFGMGAGGLDTQSADAPGATPGIDSQWPFELPGRPELAAFFNEHVVDIVRNQERYRALGIGFPGAIVLHGPPGCGKTFAVEKLIEYLGWPSLRIEAASVASPYIHDTSKKVAAIFEKAIDIAPSVLVIDEMEAFLADREMGQGHHRVEEVAEFLRRIPEAAGREVLIVAMTNRVEMIDPAILRRGRFDHIVKVDYADEIAVLSLLTNMMTGLPHEPGIDLRPLASSLAGRPLSDVTFVVREAGRRAAKDGRNALTQEDLSAALASAPPPQGAQRNRIGFI
jgi:cell division protease FtsH